MAVFSFSVFWETILKIMLFIKYLIKFTGQVILEFSLWEVFNHSLNVLIVITLYRFFFVSVLINCIFLRNLFISSNFQVYWNKVVCNSLLLWWLFNRNIILISQELSTFTNILSNFVLTFFFILSLLLRESLLCFSMEYILWIFFSTVNCFGFCILVFILPSFLNDNLVGYKILEGQPFSRSTLNTLLLAFVLEKSNVSQLLFLCR